MAAVVNRPPARGPLADDATWRAVVERAGYRCECRGECGRAHSAYWARPGHEAEGRCLAEQGRAGVRLCVTPRAPVDQATAARLEAAELYALCQRCLAAVITRRAREARRARQVPDQQAQLF